MLTHAPTSSLQELASSPFRIGEVVVRPPRDPGRLVGHARHVPAGLLGGDVPHQRGTRDQPAGQARQLHAGVVRHHSHGAIRLAQDQSARAGQQRPGEGLHAVAAYLLHFDVAVDELFQQLVGADQIELEVLLDHPRSIRVGERLERHRGRVDQPRHVGEAQVVAAGFEIDLALVPDHRVAGHRIAPLPAIPVHVRRDGAGLRRAVDGKRVGHRLGGDGRERRGEGQGQRGQAQADVSVHKSSFGLWGLQRL